MREWVTEGFEAFRAGTPAAVRADPAVIAA